MVPWYLSIVVGLVVKHPFMVVGHWALSLPDLKQGGIQRSVKMFETRWDFERNR